MKFHADVYTHSANTVACQWVFTIKFLAEVYTHTCGLDYVATFSPTSRQISIRIIVLIVFPTLLSLIMYSLCPMLLALFILCRKFGIDFFSVIKLVF